ncbi:DUF6894 family protein [Bosea sp. UC22_33]|uniref:DUF6894 family protein n=1 Tax=Bosea sp. UC22_33 TaxID=3350165 RepID=UPI00366B3B2D
MPLYRFITSNTGDHAVEIECPDDKAARQEARKALAEAAHDALVDADASEMSMTVETEGRVIYQARFSFAASEVN